MFICPACDFEVSNDKAICDQCGYDFNLKEIPDASKLKSLLDQLKRQGKWQEEIRIKKQVTEIQKQKHGGASTTPNKGWSERATSKFIGESHPTTSQDILLAKELLKHPELLRCKNKTSAKKILKEIQRSPSASHQPHSFEREDDLQTFIVEHLDNISTFKDWEFVNANIFQKGKYNTSEIGEIDLLLKYKTEPKWLVVELKREQSSDETVGQILRYMGWVTDKLADKNDKIEGMILSSSSDKALYYALICTQNIRIFRYIHQEEGFSLFEDEYSKLKRLFQGLSKDERKKLLELFNQSNNSDLTD